MSQPPAPYDRQYNFTNYQTANPSAPLPGQKVDQELNAVRTALNDTQVRLGEIQADDGKVRTTALNLQVIAEEVEPLLTEAPVQAVLDAGTQQVGLVNAAGAAKVAQLEAVLTSQNAIDALNAASAAETSADVAASSAVLANGYAGSAQAYANAAIQAKNSAIAHAEAAQAAVDSIPLIQGPAGPQGLQGIQGIQGPAGVAGPAGPQGQQGIQGPQGVQGINGDQYKTNSSTTLLVSNGTKTLTVSPGLAYTSQQNVVIAFNTSAHMHGLVISYDSATGAMVVDVSQHTGTGSASTWTVNLEGAAGIQGPQGIQGIQGPAGVAGVAGAQGIQGIQGIQGDTGPQGPAGNAWSYTGTFDYGRTYNPNEMVDADGSSYVMSNYIGGAGYHPASYPGHWQLIASRGTDGAPGGQGNDGATGPQGPQGEPGSQGPAGPGVINWRGQWDYSTYYNQNDAVAYDGSSYICNSSNAYNSPYEGSGQWGLLARKGDTGPAGQDGSGGGSPPYYNSVWVYGQWYSASVTTLYDNYNYQYVNVLTF